MKRNPTGNDDLATIAGLLAKPQPARVVLSGFLSAWQLTVTAAGWEFQGDERVLETIRKACEMVALS